MEGITITSSRTVRNFEYGKDGIEVQGTYTVDGRGTVTNITFSGEVDGHGFDGEIARDGSASIHGMPEGKGTALAALADDIRAAVKESAAA